MQCTKCHSEVGGFDAFCTHCGAALSSPPPTAFGPKSFPLRTIIFAAAVLLICAAVAVVIAATHASARTAERHSAELQDQKVTAVQKHIEDQLAQLKAAADATADNHAPASTTADATNTNQPAAAPAQSAADRDPAAPPSEAAAPVAGNGDPAHDWPLQYERTENGPDADLIVRTGDINNLGFGWPAGFDPFSGKSTPVHHFPFEPKPDEPAGTDRIMLASVIDPREEMKDPVAYNQKGSDGYSWILSDCRFQDPCKARQDSMPRAVTLRMGALPTKIHGVVLQMFVDDFQAHHFHSHFQVSLNGTRIPSFEDAVNSLDQTGPIGKLITLRLLPEYWPLLQSGEVRLMIDDPTTKVRDGYAMDFVRLLVNPHDFKYQVTVKITVIDGDTHHPIAGANVNAALENAVADAVGKCEFKGVPAGLVVATASAPGYDSGSTPIDVEAGQVGQGVIELSPHREDAASLERALAQSGSVNLYGIHFDTDSARLRADSVPALNALLQVLNNHPDSHWMISGHTDSQGSDAHNQPLSENRAASVIAWLKQHGIDDTRLAPQGYGASRPVADNATAGGRALNRRVEVSSVK